MPRRVYSGLGGSHLAHTVGAQVWAGLQSSDDLLVMCRVVSEADLELTQKPPTALKRLLLRKLQKNKQKGIVRMLPVPL